MKHSLLNWILFISLSLIWGSSFILMKRGMVSLSAYQVGAMRMFSAGIVLLPSGLRALKIIPKNKRPLIFLTGLLGSFFPAFFYCLAETKIDSGLTAILNALTPLCTIVVGIIFFGKAFAWQKFVGVMIGFAGLCFLLFSGGKISWNDLGYTTFVLFATLFYGINVNLVGKYLQNFNSTQIAAVAFLQLLPISFSILLFTGYFNQFSLSADFLSSTGAAVLLGVMGTAVGTILFYAMIKSAGGLFATMVTYAIPFVAIFWGWLAGEKITPLQVACLFIILSGVFLASVQAPAKIKSPRVGL